MFLCHLIKLCLIQCVLSSCGLGCTCWRFSEDENLKRGRQDYEKVTRIQSAKWQSSVNAGIILGVRSDQGGFHGRSDARVDLAAWGGVRGCVWWEKQGRGGSQVQPHDPVS